MIPSLFTVANLLCGYYASIAALVGGREDFDHAAKALGIAILFDSLDGRIARMTGTNTEFGGAAGSSLMDVVSLELRRAILAYAWGFRYAFGTSGEFHQLGEFAWICCLAFLICSAWRLARFNVKGMEPGGNKNLLACRRLRLPGCCSGCSLAAFLLIHQRQQELGDRVVRAAGSGRAG